MKNVALLCLPFLLLLILESLPYEEAIAFDEPMQSIGTGNVTGVYYAAGSAIAKMHNMKRKKHDLRLIAEASEGSVANIQNVLNGTKGFGIAQANVLYHAMQGSGFWEGAPQKNLRAVLGLYTEGFTVVTVASAGISTLVDLKGKRVNIGEPGSADDLQAPALFKHVGVDPDKDLTITRESTYEASELLQSGDIDAYLYTVGHPNLSVIEASAGDRKIEIISPGTEIIEALTEAKPFLAATDISVDYYPNLVNTKPIPTFGYKAILFTTADMDDTVTYQIVKEVYENFDLFRRQHPVLASLTVQNLTEGLIAPIHPGASRYFKEAGLFR